MAANYFALHERRAHCSTLIGDKLYVWGGVTTEHIYPAANEEEDDDDSESDDSDGPSSPTLVKLRKLLPDPKDNFVDVFDTVTRLWWHYTTTGDVPPGDYGSSLCPLDNQFIFLFGAYNGLNFSSSLYRLNVETFEWTKIEPNTPTLPLPSARVGMVDYHQHLCVFGGVCTRPPDERSRVNPSLLYQETASGNKPWGWSNEYCEFNVAKGEWQIVDVRNPPPPCGGAAFVQFDSHRAISFGGRVGENLSNAFFILDLSTKVWSGPINPPGEDIPWPIPRTFHTLTCLVDPDKVGDGLLARSLKQKMLLLWGKSKTAAPSVFSDEAWIMESVDSSSFEDNVQWTRVRLPLFPRSWHTVVPQYDPHSTMLYLLGGNTPSTDDAICMVKPFQRKQRGDFRNLQWGVPNLQTLCLNTVVKVTKGLIGPVCQILPEKLALLLRDHVRKQGYFPIVSIHGYTKEHSPAEDGSENTQFMRGL